MSLQIALHELLQPRPRIIVLPCPLSKLDDGVDVLDKQRIDQILLGRKPPVDKPLVTLIGRLRGKQIPYGDRGVIVTLPT